MSEIKVLRVVSTMNPAKGGVVEAISQASLSFNRKGGVMDVLCFDDLNSPWLNTNYGYSIYSVGRARTAYKINLAYFHWLWKNARNYDVVVLDGLWQFLSLGGYLLKLLGVPFCVFVHGMLDPYFNQNKKKFFKKLPFWWVSERNILALAKFVIFTCQVERDLAKNSFPAYKARSRVATLGVEGSSVPAWSLLKCFYSSFPALVGKKFALFLSRIHKKKGIDILIEALGNISALPDDFILAIAGPDSEGLKEILQEKIQRLRIESKVAWLGMLEGDVKWGAYQAAEVFILPSHQENFGIVIAEALSTSTPVLISNKVNIWKEVNSMGAGFVENDDVNGVEKLLCAWLALSRSERLKMSERARICHEERFSTLSASSDLGKIINDAMEFRLEARDS